MKTSYANESSRFTTCDGARVHYRDEGSRDAPPIVLVHGILSSLHTWDGWVRVLSKKYRVIRLDLPGFGLTGPWLEERPYDLGSFVQFLARFLDELKIEKCILAGHSLGGWISWEFACAFPDRVTRLILVSPAGFDLDHPPLAVRLMRLPVIRFLVRRWAPSFIVRLIVKSAFGKGALLSRETVVRHRELFLREGNRDAFLRMVREPLSASTEKLKGMSTPTLVLWGERDRWISARNARRFADSIHGVTVKTYGDAGHLLAEERPDETSLEVLRFIGA